MNHFYLMALLSLVSFFIRVVNADRVGGKGPWNPVTHGIKSLETGIEMAIQAEPGYLDSGVLQRILERTNSVNISVDLEQFTLFARECWMGSQERTGIQYYAYNFLRGLNSTTEQTNDLYKGVQAELDPVCTDKQLEHLFAFSLFAVGLLGCVGLFFCVMCCSLPCSNNKKQDKNQADDTESYLMRPMTQGKGG